MSTRVLSSLVPTTKASTFPEVIASRSSSASCRRWRSDSISSCSGSTRSFMALPQLRELQPDQRAFGIRKIADDLADRHRELAHQRRDGDDLVILGEARVLQQVDDLDLVAAGEVLVADF